MYVGPEITCSIDSFESFSQVNQDTVIHTMFPSRGYFIDLAANAGSTYPTHIPLKDTVVGMDFA